MKKHIEKINGNDVKGFVLNFLAVVLGIVITFSGEGIISSHNEKKEVKSSLELVKNELQDNLSYIQFADSILLNSAQSATFLLSYMEQYENAPVDSMNMYCNVPLMQMDISSSEEVLELLKNSSLFTKIKNQKLSLDIIHAYGTVEDRMKMYKMLFSNIDNYRTAAISGDVKRVLSEGNVTAAQLWSTLTMTIEGRQFLREMERMNLYVATENDLKPINETITKIDKYIGNK